MEKEKIGKFVSADIFLDLFLLLQQACIEEEQNKQKRQAEENAHASTSSDSRKPRIKKSAYFSDEEELSD